MGTASAISAAPADNAIAPPQVDATQQATASAVMADAAAAGTAPRFAELRHSTKEKSIFLLCAGDAEKFGRWWLLGNPAQIRILVDKNHCQAWMAHNGSVFVRDLNTTHGTVVGGHRLKRGETRELFAGESISFGETNPFVSLFFRADATPPPAAHASSLGDDAPPLSACLESFFQGAQPPDEPPDELASVVSLVSVFSRLGASPALSSAELHRGAAVMREAASMLGYDPGEEDAEEAEKDEDMEGGEHDEDGEEDAVFGSGCPLSSEEEKEEDDDEEANENIDDSIYDESAAVGAAEYSILRATAAAAAAAAAAEVEQTGGESGGRVGQKRRIPPGLAPCPSSSRPAGLPLPAVQFTFFAVQGRQLGVVPGSLGKFPPISDEPVFLPLIYLAINQSCAQYNEAMAFWQGCFSEWDFWISCIRVSQAGLPPIPFSHRSSELAPNCPLVALMPDYYDQHVQVSVLEKAGILHDVTACIQQIFSNPSPASGEAGVAGLAHDMAALQTGVHFFSAAGVLEAARAAVDATEGEAVPVLRGGEPALQGGEPRGGEPRAPRGGEPAAPAPTSSASQATPTRPRCSGTCSTNGRAYMLWAQARAPKAPTMCRSRLIVSPPPTESS